MHCSCPLIQFEVVGWLVPVDYSNWFDWYLMNWFDSDIIIALIHSIFRKYYCFNLHSLIMMAAGCFACCLPASTAPIGHVPTLLITTTTSPYLFFPGNRFTSCACSRYTEHSNSCLTLSSYCFCPWLSLSYLISPYSEISQTLSTDLESLGSNSAL